MKLIISLDYELFFGSKIGTVDNCLIKPIDRLLEVINPYDIKLSLFVDSGFLLRLQKYQDKFPQLNDELERVSNHIRSLHNNGHDIQLHIHPHWEDTHFDGEDWNFDFDRYRLHDFDKTNISEIVNRYKQALTEIVGDNVFAYRAGGWCLQPFDALSDALSENNIWLESTVFLNGVSEQEKRGFNFTGSPDKSSWWFDRDPLVPVPSGPFFEVPISAVKANPLFFWHMVYSKIIKQKKHHTFGDGIPLRFATKSQYMKMLFKPVYNAVSIDGAKTRLLKSAYKQLTSDPQKDIFNIMGHPKAFTEYGLEQLARFLAKHTFNSITYQDFKNTNQ